MFHLFVFSGQVLAWSPPIPENLISYLNGGASFTYAVIYTILDAPLFIYYILIHFIIIFLYFASLIIKKTQNIMSPIPFSVPTIDIAPYLSDPISPESSEIVSAIKNACTTTGFFQLIGHGIPSSLQDAVFKGAEALFNLPMEEKVKLDRGKSVGASNRGYELIGGQGLQEGTLPDLKEVNRLSHLLNSN